jgi:predicted dehydrogenase
VSLRLGLIGCGNISSLYLKSARHYHELDVVACADVDMALAKARAAEFGIPQVLSSEALLARADIDAVVNLTPPAAHAEVAVQALEAGKHVYNEKPLAANFADAQALVRLAAGKGLRLACAPSTFLGATIQTARAAIEQGLIGRPVAANAVFMSHGMEHWHPNPETFYQPGAGPIFDIGPYYLTALVHLLGAARSVTASASISFTERTISSEAKAGQTFQVNTPTHIAGTISFASGAIVSVVSSFDVWHSRVPKLEIYGSEGTLAIEAANMFGAKVELRQAQDEHWRELELISEHQDFEASWALALADLAWAIAENRAHRASAEQALHVLELMQAFLSSAASGQRVAIESTP